LLRGRGIKGDGVNKKIFPLSFDQERGIKGVR